MSRLDALIGEFAKLNGGEMKWRLEKELKYARRVSFVNGGKHDTLLLKAIEGARALHDKDGALTDGAVLQIEAMLAPMQEDCKKFRLLMVGHAHIDMNWMWRYDETVSITLDTFRTMLNLMREFPKFTFAQSQASTYAIVAEHEPEMLSEIKERIQSGQWEVSASTWVEADRNMPSAESVARHFLYTKRYLPALLGVDGDALNFDFEPDTFGHNQNVPEMLAQAGVKFYYHCRGEEKETLYRWRAPSGKQILCYREPWWYLGGVSGDEAERVPEFCARFDIDTGMTVYGVGDHGGGPTRRDLERIEGMANWPIYPRVEFGTYQQFYACAEGAKDVPVLTGERNVVFTGCYTTQTRIKQGNRIGERMLFDAEAMGAYAALNAGTPYRRAAFEKGWRNVLFNQFHDIIPGSGVIDTREHAMGLYHDTFAVAGSALRGALNGIAGRIDTAGFVPADPKGSTSEGAGQGFSVYDFKLGQVSRGGGKNRVFHVFNPLPQARRGLAEFVLWDYLEPLSRIEFVNDKGEVTRHQVLDAKFKEYWQHEWAKVLVEVEVPAMGYASYALRLKDEADMLLPIRQDPRVEKPFEMVLENELIRAEFDPWSGQILQLVDKTRGEEIYLGGADFRLIEEDATMGMTSWVVGRYMNVTEVGERATIKLLTEGPLYKAYSVQIPFGNKSTLSYVVSLGAGDNKLDFDVRCDWHERGYQDSCIPQLNFCAQTDAETFVCDIPGGLIERPSQALDVPTQGMIQGGGLILMSDSKYGFRGDMGEMSVTLIRSSFDPDPYPELGNHHFRLALGVSAKAGAALLGEAAEWNHPLHVISGNHHEGSEPLSRSFMKLSGGAVLSGVKLAEDEDALVLRLCDVDGAGLAVVEFDREIKTAVRVDTLERPVDLPVRIDKKRLEIPMDRSAIAAVKLTFK